MGSGRFVFEVCIGWFHPGFSWGGHRAYPGGLRSGESPLEIVLSAGESDELIMGKSLVRGEEIYRLLPIINTAVEAAADHNQAKT